MHIEHATGRGKKESKHTDSVACGKLWPICLCPPVVLLEFSAVVPVVPIGPARRDFCQPDVGRRGAGDLFFLG